MIISVEHCIAANDIDDGAGDKVGDFIGSDTMTWSSLSATYICQLINASAVYQKARYLQHNAIKNL